MVFAVRDVTVDELAQQVPLVRFAQLSLLTVRDVLAAGMRLEPTGRNPRHYTVSFDDLEEGVQRLVSCERCYRTDTEVEGGDGLFTRRAGYDSGGMRCRGTRSMDTDRTE